MSNFEEFFEKIKIEMSIQTKEIISQIDGKLQPITQELENLKLENQELRNKINNLEKSKKSNNIIFYGLEEKEHSQSELLDEVVEKIKKDLKINLDNRDINIIQRIGKVNKVNNKGRPVLISFINNWKKKEVMKNKKYLKDIYASEDYPKEVQEKRKELQVKLIEERKKGNYAIINYDKLIIKEGTSHIATRKRNLTISPEKPRKQVSLTSSNNKKNAFDIMRVRSNSLSSSPAGKLL